MITFKVYDKIKKKYVHGLLLTGEGTLVDPS